MSNNMNNNKEDDDEKTRQYLTFEVCEGLTNQRIAIIHGLLIAHIMDRTAVLPDLQSSFDLTKSTSQQFADF